MKQQGKKSQANHGVTNYNAQEVSKMMDRSLGNRDREHEEE
jgi:hypothetical protein